MKHLVFYDGECGLCDQVVQFLLKADKNKGFVFAPLQGKHAALALKDLPEEAKQADSIILIEDYQELDYLTLHCVQIFYRPLINFRFHR